VTIAEFDEVAALSALFARQADAMAMNGSVLYEGICRAASLELSQPSPLTQVLAPWASARVGDMIPLRILGASHRLVLERRAPALGLFYPTVGGAVPTDARSRQMCFEAFVSALVAHQEELPNLLAGPPQTNEIARATALAGVMHMVAAQWQLPIRLHECGTSAGLHLRADHLRISGDGVTVGPVDSPVSLPDAWEGLQAPLAEPVVSERVGVDRDPVDVTSTDGRLHLTSFVWPDQLDRYERLRGAWKLVDQVPAQVIRGDLVRHLKSLRLQEGTALIVWHSSVWMYLSDDERTEFDRSLEELAQQASPTRPLVEVSREFRQGRIGSSFPVVIRAWPTLSWLNAEAGDRVVLGDSPAQGLPMRWTEPHIQESWSQHA
jgi:hypothetical protein